MYFFDPVSIAQTLLITGLSNPPLNPAEFYLVDILQQLIPGVDPAQQKGCVVFCLCPRSSKPGLSRGSMESQQRIWHLRQGCHHPSRAGDASHPSTPEGKLNIDRAAQMSPQPACALCHLVVPEGTSVVMFWGGLGLNQAGSSSRIPAAATLARPYQLFWAGAGTHLQYLYHQTLLTSRQHQLLDTHLS